MDNLELATAELPEAVRAWLAERSAVVLSIEVVDGERVLIRPLPNVAPEIIAQAQVTIAKYREALMNLT